MQINGLKNKIYIAVCGMPDCGKSTFIKHLTQYITKRKVAVDSFCDEQLMDMTIRSAQIFMRDNCIPYDLVFLDCPGHIFEYEDEVKSVLSKAHFVLKIKNDKQNEIVPYNDFYKDENLWEQKFSELNYCYQKDQIILYSHSDKTELLAYDADGLKTDKFDRIFGYINDYIKVNDFTPVDPIETAIRVIKFACEKIPGEKVAMCSYGKDSLVMLKLFELAGVLDQIKIEYPNSGFDLPGISDQFKNEVNYYFKLPNIESFDVIENGWNFENHSAHEMMLCKARMLTDRINEKNYKVCFTGIRRDEEGTRAKEKFFSPRTKDGTYDYLKPQKEIFGNELDSEILNYPQIRVNPLLDLCEADIWYMTRHFDIPICSEYISKNGKRYRSLGDWPITTPIDSDVKTIDEICDEVNNSLIPERACRAKQDNAVRFGMEKLRKVGFF